MVVHIIQSCLLVDGWLSLGGKLQNLWSLEVMLMKSCELATSWNIICKRKRPESRWWKTPAYHSTDCWCFFISHKMDIAILPIAGRRHAGKITRSLVSLMKVTCLFVGDLATQIYRRVDWSMSCSHGRTAHDLVVPWRVLILAAAKWVWSPPHSWKWWLTRSKNQFKDYETELENTMPSKKYDRIWLDESAQVRGNAISWAIWVASCCRHDPVQRTPLRERT